MVADLGKNFGRSLRKNIEKKLQANGISLRPTDLAALIEEKAPKTSRAALGYALDLLRPFTAGMGLRVTKLSDRKIEIQLPQKTRNQGSAGRIHEGALLTAAIEAARLLWLRHLPQGDFTMNVKESSLSVLQAYEGDLRVRMELTEMQRETVLMQLRSRREATPAVSVNIYDAKEKSIAKIEMILAMKHVPALSHP